MTNAEARKYLHSIKEQDEELYRKLSQIAELRTAVENCTSKLDKDGSQMSSPGDKLSNLMCKILDLEKECERLRISADNTRKTVLELANELIQEPHKEYLLLRFVECNGFYDTAMKMGISDMKARRIDRKIVSEFAKYGSKHNI
jgi:hypothetical protein